MAYKYKNKSGGDTAKYVKWGLVGVCIVALLAFGKTLLNKFAGGLSLMGSKKTGDKLFEQMNTGAIKPDGTANVRLPFIKSVCESIHKEIDAFNQDEANIVKLCNSLSSGQEAATASAYYRTAYGSSLKAELEEALDSDANPWGFGFAKTHYSDIRDVIRKNLV